MHVLALGSSEPQLTLGENKNPAFGDKHLAAVGIDGASETMWLTSLIS